MIKANPATVQIVRCSRTRLGDHRLRLGHSGSSSRQHQNGLMAAARHPVVAFMVISLGAYFLAVAIPPILNAQVLPFDLPLHGFLGGCSASVSAHSWSLERSRAAKALLILLGVACGGASRCVGIWSQCSPFRSGPH
jgi:hypothetical protein